MAGHKLTAFEFGRMLVESGVITKEELNQTERIVIDADGTTGLVSVYVKKYGDRDALARLAPMLKDVIPSG